VTQRLSFHSQTDEDPTPVHVRHRVSNKNRDVSRRAKQFARSSV
jgi:hypothetical protein